MYQARQACAEMSKGATLTRQFSLALRPRPLPELLQAGRTLQADLPAPTQPPASSLPANHPHRPQPTPSQPHPSPA